MTVQQLEQRYWLPGEIARDDARLAQMPTTPMYDELRGLIVRSTQRRRDELNALDRWLSAVDDPVAHQILDLRYVQGLPWLDVAEAIGSSYTDSTVKKIAQRYIAKH